MRGKSALFGLAFIALLLGLSIGAYFYSKSAQTPLLQAHVNGVTLYLEEAKTPADQAKGLGGRDSLDTNHGMLFRLGTPQIAKFWMKDMRFPLDFLWLKNGTVVDTSEHIAAPITGLPDSSLPIISPKTPADAVIEVGAGFVAYDKIQIGQIVTGL